MPAQTPTPVPLRGCPLRFTDSNTGDDDSSCWFNVTNPGNCGPDRFYSNGTQVIYVNDFVGDTGFYTGYFAATVASPTQATVTGRWIKPDLSDYRTASGSISLNPDGTRFTTNINGGLFCGHSQVIYSEQRFPPRSEIRAMFRILASR